jgi:hypothetical protein
MFSVRYPLKNKYMLISFWSFCPNFPLSQSISLVVSDWKDVNSRVLLSHLDDSYHPFSEVIVMLPKSAIIPTSPFPSATPVRFVFRDDYSYDYIDLCTAPVHTRWFMWTDSYHRIRPKLHILTQQGQPDPMVHTENTTPNGYQNTHRPIASYIRATNETCFDYPSCTRDLTLARQIDPNMNDVFQNHDMVFNKQHLQEYCQFWNSSQDSAYLLSPPTPPSAMSYMAYLRLTQLADRLYSFSDRAIMGSRLPFLALPDDLLSQEMRRQRNDISPRTSMTVESLIKESARTVNNQTDCTILVVQGDCMANNSCQWQASFETCHDRNSVDGVATTTINNQASHGRPRELRPTWVSALIGLGLASGSVALLSLVGVGSRRAWHAVVVADADLGGGGGSIRQRNGKNRAGPFYSLDVVEDVHWLDQANDELRHNHKPWLPPPTLEEFAIMMVADDSMLSCSSSHSSSGSRTLGAASASSLRQNGLCQNWENVLGPDDFDPLQMVDVDLDGDDVEMVIVDNTVTSGHVSSNSSSDSSTRANANRGVGGCGVLGRNIFGAVAATALIENGHFEESSNTSVEYVRDPANDTVAL